MKPLPTPSFRNIVGHGLYMIVLLFFGSIESRAQGLVGYWRLDEGTGRTTADSSGNNHPGTLQGVGGPTWVVGQVTNALRFDGVDEYVNIPANPIFGITADLTLAAWIKREALGAYDAIVAKTDGGANFDYDFYFSNGDNRLRFWSDAGSPTPVFATREVADTNWHHVAVTRTGSTIRFYIDGLDAGTTTQTGGSANNSIPIRIGTDGPAWDPGSLFQGSIDEVRLYNRALSAAEIRGLIASGSGPEIVVANNGAILTSGDTTPSFADGTDFGVVNVGATVTRVYDIFNFGTTALTVGTAGISGPNAGDFTVTAQPAGSVAPGGGTSFAVQFSPGGLGQRRATVSFSNNDSNENPFTFAIRGSGLSTNVFPGFLTREVFTGIPNESIADLTNNAKYPNSPDASEIIGGFEAPIDVANDYGQRIYGFLMPWETANYVFFMSSDDQGELWISTDENPANKALVAREPQWNSSRDWTGTSRRAGLENRSAPIPLQAGRRYYVEALSKEGSGGDNLAVTAIKEGDPLPENGSQPLQGAFLGTFGVPGPETVTISGQPQNVNTVEGGTAAFMVTANSASSLIVYQWQRNGVNIFKANGSIYKTPPLTGANSGTQYRCITYVSSGARATSSVATVTVNEDLAAPRVVRVHCVGDPISGDVTRTTIVFDEPLDQLSAEDEFNYGIDASVTIVSAGLLPNLKAVVLTTLPFSPASGPFFLTVEAIADRAPAHNVMGSVTVPLRVSHLVARYAFDDFRELGSDSAGGNDGADFGAPNMVPGQIGSALNCDNLDDYISVPYSPDLAIGVDITLAAWIKRDSFGEYGAIASKTDGANSWDYGLLFQNGHDALVFYSGNTTPDTLLSSNIVSDSAWHHVAFTRSGNLATFYIDGVDAGTATLEGGFGGNQNPLRIGTDGPAWDPSSMFRGAIDDVRIYNRGLTAAEIQALMNPPRVTIASSGGNVVISWPAAALDYVLEFRDDLSSGNWTLVSETPVRVGDMNTVTLPAGNSTGFYRLKEQ